MLGHSFLILNLFRLSFQKLIGLSRFLKLRVYKLIFSGKSLNILGKLKTFLSFNLNNLLILLLLLSKTKIFWSQNFDLIFSFKQPSLKFIFSSSNNWNMMLHITEFKHLFFKSLLAHIQLFCFLFNFFLHIVQIRIKCRYWLF